MVKRAGVLLVVLLACTSPRIAEDSAAACSNGLDDDGNGLADCADPSCVKSGACELDAASCSNGLDDDGDGRVDCEEDSCIKGGFCEKIAADCDVIHQTGCVRGMACQPVDPVAGTPRVCVRPGITAENHRCAPTAEDPGGGCQAGTICYSLGLCAQPCETYFDCPRSSLCIRGEQPYGVCSLTCFPALGCVDGYGCVALQRTNDAYAYQGWMHSCFTNEAIDGLLAKAAATVGQPCVDGAVTSTPPETVCATGLLCVPEPSGNVCREVCLANIDGSDGKNCATGRCVVIDPFDPRPPRSNELYRVGVCLP